MFDKVKNIRPIDWVLVVAGAAFGGAILHQSRLLGGAIVGGAAFAYVYSQAPCCSGCAKTSTPCADASKAATVRTPTVMVSEQLATGGIVASQDVSTATFSNDYAGSLPAGTFDPAKVWQAIQFDASQGSSAAQSPVVAARVPLPGCGS